jgi:hypothetical protein
MTKLGHILAHVFRTNLEEVGYGAVEGHLWYGLRCLECGSWRPTCHSMACPCVLGLTASNSTELSQCSQNTSETAEKVA